MEERKKEEFTETDEELRKGRGNKKREGHKDRDKELIANYECNRKN